MTVKKAPAVVTNAIASAVASDQYLVTKDTEVMVSVQGTFVANLRLKASYDNGTTWAEIYVFTAPDTLQLCPAGTPLLELDASGGGDYTSGTANVFIGF